MNNLHESAYKFCIYYQWDSNHDSTIINMCRKGILNGKFSNDHINYIF